MQVQALKFGVQHEDPDISVITHWSILIISRILDILLLFMFSIGNHLFIKKKYCGFLHSTHLFNTGQSFANRLYMDMEGKTRRDGRVEK